jgi:hypothetical protein
MILATSLVMVSPSVGRSAITTLSMNNAADNTLVFGIAFLAGVAGPVDISGSVVVDTIESSGEITSIEVLGGDLTLSDATIADNVLFFGSVPGTFSVTFTGVHASVVGGPFGVGATFFNPDGLQWTFDQGTIDLAIDSAVTGPLSLSVDLALTPAVFNSPSTTREGIVFPASGSINLFLPMDLNSAPIDVGTGNPVFFVFQASLNSVAIPEVSPMALLGVATLIGAALQRRASKS